MCALTMSKGILYPCVSRNQRIPLPVNLEMEDRLWMVDRGDAVAGGWYKLQLKRAITNLRDFTGRDNLKLCDVAFI